MLYVIPLNPVPFVVVFESVGGIIIPLVGYLLFVCVNGDFASAASIMIFEFVCMLLFVIVILDTNFLLDCFFYFIYFSAISAARKHKSAHGRFL